MRRAIQSNVDIKSANKRIQNVIDLEELKIRIDY